MTLTNMKRTALAAITSLGMAAAGPALAQTAQADDQDLASSSLADGQAFKAIRALETEVEANPNDPALRINLGIAHAQAGNEAEALSHFEAAMRSREVLELDTADGRTTDSRKLARQAIAMLERGDFRPATAQSDQLTLRD